MFVHFTDDIRHVYIRGMRFTDTERLLIVCCFPLALQFVRVTHLKQLRIRSFLIFIKYLRFYGLFERRTENGSCVASGTGVSNLILALYSICIAVLSRKIFIQILCFDGNGRRSGTRQITSN